MASPGTAGLRKLSLQLFDLSAQPFVLTPQLFTFALRTLGAFDLFLKRRWIDGEINGFSRLRHTAVMPESACQYKRR